MADVVQYVINTLTNPANYNTNSIGVAVMALIMLGVMNGDDSFSS